MEKGKNNYVYPVHSENDEIKKRWGSIIRNLFLSIGRSNRNGFLKMQLFARLDQIYDALRKKQN
ncbi:MAG: hypothetical protein AAB705_00920 [Patescibacteria group bacterium]